MPDIPPTIQDKINHISQVLSSKQEFTGGIVIIQKIIYDEMVQSTRDIISTLQQENEALKDALAKTSETVTKRSKRRS